LAVIGFVILKRGLIKLTENLVSEEWGTMVEEEDWRRRHDETRLAKKDVSIERVLVASCSDDGSIRVSLPLEVRLIGVTELIGSKLFSINLSNYVALNKYYYYYFHHDIVMYYRSEN